MKHPLLARLIGRQVAKLDRARARLERAHTHDVPGAADLLAQLQAARDAAQRAADDLRAGSGGIDALSDAIRATERADELTERIIDKLEAAG